MQHQQTHQDTFEFTGKHMLLLMIVFFGIIMSVNVTMAIIAKGSWTGLVVKNSYVASQEFNGKLEKAKAQKALGLHSEVAYEKGVLTIRIMDGSGNSVADSDLLVRIGRPAYEQLDQEVTLKPASDSTFQLHMPLETGPWALEINGRVNEHPYRRDVRLFVGADGSASVE